MDAVGPGRRRSFHTRGADSCTLPSGAVHRATISLGPGESATSELNDVPDVRILAAALRPLSCSVRSPQSAVPETRSVHANASPPRRSNETMGFPLVEGEGGDGIGDDPVSAGVDRGWRDGGTSRLWPCVQAPANEASATSAAWIALLGRTPPATGLALRPRQGDAPDELLLEDEEHDDER